MLVAVSFPLPSLPSTFFPSLYRDDLPEVDFCAWKQLHFRVNVVPDLISARYSGFKQSYPRSTSLTRILRLAREKTLETSKLSPTNIQNVLVDFLGGIWPVFQSTLISEIGDKV